MPLPPTYTDLSDDQIFAAYCAGDETARDYLWEKYTPRIYSFILRKVGDESTASGLATDVLIKLWEKCDTFSPMNKFFGFVCSVAKTTVSDYWKKEAAHQGVSGQGIFTGKTRTIFVSNPDSATPGNTLSEPGPDDFVWAQDLWQQYNECKSNLSQMQRLCWVQKQEHELTREEIAQKEGIGIETVKTHLRSARKKIIECMGDYYKDLFPEEGDG